MVRCPSKCSSTPTSPGGKGTVRKEKISFKSCSILHCRGGTGKSASQHSEQPPKRTRKTIKDNHRAREDCFNEWGDQGWVHSEKRCRSPRPYQHVFTAGLLEVNRERAELRAPQKQRKLMPNRGLTRKGQGARLIEKKLERRKKEPVYIAAQQPEVNSGGSVRPASTVFVGTCGDTEQSSQTCSRQEIEGGRFWGQIRWPLWAGKKARRPNEFAPKP